MMNPEPRTTEAPPASSTRWPTAWPLPPTWSGNLLAHVERLTTDVLRDAVTVADEATDLWEAVTVRATEVSLALRGTPRFARVAGEMLRVIAAYRWHAATGDLFADSTREESLADLHERSAERLYALCIELRGGVLKLGQFASSRMDLLPDAYVTALSRLQDRVPPAPLEAILDRIADELGGDLAEHFSRFDAVPLAAASLAQVHAAALVDGTAVAVKVQLPEIEQLVEIDLTALQMLVPALRDLLPFMDLDTFAAELSRAVRAELDYRSEAAHAASFADAFAGDADVVIRASTRRTLAARARARAPRRRASHRLPRRVRGARREGAAIATACSRSSSAPSAPRSSDTGCCTPIPIRATSWCSTARPGRAWRCSTFGCVQTYSASAGTPTRPSASAILAGDTARMAELFGVIGFATRDGDDASLRAFADLLWTRSAPTPTSPLPRSIPAKRWSEFLRLTRDNPIVAVPSDFVLLGRVFATLAAY
jgi:ubiquinone biosynthesis protein